MKLDQYKKELQNRSAVYQIYIILAFLFVMFGNMLLRGKFQDQDASLGFATGLAAGLEIILIFRLFKIKNALKDEKILKESYIKEKDEREETIRLKSGYPTVLILSIGIFIAAILAGFFSKTVFYTLVTVGFCQVLVVLALKIYRKNKI